MQLFTRKEEQARQDIKLDIVRQEELKINQALQGKIAQLNTFNLEMEAQITAKRAELLDAQVEFQDFIRSKSHVVEGLEQRKVEALAPLTRELEELEAKKHEVANAIDDLALKEIEDTQRKERLSTKEAVFRIHEFNTLSMLKESKEALDRRDQETANRVGISKQLMTAATKAGNRLKSKELEVAASLEELEAVTLRQRAKEALLNDREAALGIREAKAASTEARLIAARKEYGRS